MTDPSPKSNTNPFAGTLFPSPDILLGPISQHHHTRFLHMNLRPHSTKVPKVQRRRALRRIELGMLTQAQKGPWPQHREGKSERGGPGWLHTAHSQTRLGFFLQARRSFGGGALRVAGTSRWAADTINTRTHFPVLQRERCDMKGGHRGGEK